MSGLRPDVDLADPWTGYDTAIALAIEEVPTSPPGERFVYSDINFFLLGDIVRRVSGLTLDRFAKQEIFEPLGMKDTLFLPAAVAAARGLRRPNAARRSRWPCEGAERQMLRGVVHDPTARRMGGVAGHAGLVQHGGRPGDLLPDAARRRRVPRQRACSRRWRSRR